MENGRFEWIRRMGVHEAYHQATANRWVHWLCIPIELFAVVKLLTLVRLGPVDLAWVALAAIGLIYLATDLFAGALMIVFLAGLRFGAVQVSSGTAWLDAVIALGVFVVFFVVQTRVGHGVYENGIDDTEQNLAELRKTKNPVPILLVFYYHLLELLFAVGYRPGLRDAVNAHTQLELAKIRGPKA